MKTVNSQPCTDVHTSLRKLYCLVQSYHDGVTESVCDKVALMYQCD